MNGRIPHIVQYQGSKRILAPQILQYMPMHFNRLVEPFSGMAAVSIAASAENRADSYLINDLNGDIVDMLRCAIDSPDALIQKYTDLWNEQFAFPAGSIEHYYHVRERYNYGEHQPELTLYLLARCVKGAVRYSQDGFFNQSPDKRRNGATPQNVSVNVKSISALLKGRTVFSAVDYRDIFEIAKPGDLIYMDPPYQGVSDTKDKRYLAGVAYDDFARALESLNRKGIDFLVSYDGECGGETYGRELPEELYCKKILLNAGISTQSTLLGRRKTTFEALYISKGLAGMIADIPEQTSFLDRAV